MVFFMFLLCNNGACFGACFGAVVLILLQELSVEMCSVSLFSGRHLALYFASIEVMYWTVIFLEGVLMKVEVD